MTKLKQIEDYPTGDCVRTVFACLLGKKKPTDIPNFMRDGESKYTEYLNSWLKKNNMSYIEISLKAFQSAFHIPEGYCTIAGKSPKADYDHLVVGEVKNRKEGKEIFRDLYFIHDTAKNSDDTFIDGEVKTIGFLSKSIFKE